MAGGESLPEFFVLPLLVFETRLQGTNLARIARWAVYRQDMFLRPWWLKYSPSLFPLAWRVGHRSPWYRVHMQVIWPSHQPRWQYYSWRFKPVRRCETYCRVIDKKSSGWFNNWGNILRKNSICVASYKLVFPGWKYFVNIRRRSLHASPYGRNDMSHFQPILNDEMSSEEHRFELMAHTIHSSS